MSRSMQYMLQGLNEKIKKREITYREEIEEVLVGRCIHSANKEELAEKVNNLITRKTGIADITYHCKINHQLPERAIEILIDIDLLKDLLPMSEETWKKRQAENREHTLNVEFYKIHCEKRVEKLFKLLDVIVVGSGYNGLPVALPHRSICRTKQLKMLEEAEAICYSYKNLSKILKEKWYYEIYDNWGSQERKDLIKQLKLNDKAK